MYIYILCIYIIIYILHCDDSPSVVYCISSLHHKSHHPSLSMDHEKVSGCQTSSLHNSVAIHFSIEEYFQLVCLSIFFHKSIATFVGCGIRGCTLWESDPSSHCSNQNRVRRSCLGNSCVRPQAPCARVPHQKPANTDELMGALQSWLVTSTVDICQVQGIINPSLPQSAPHEMRRSSTPFAKPSSTHAP